MQPISDLPTLLARMRPSLAPGRYAFVAVPAGVVVDPARIVASVREAEGLSVVIPEADALALDLPVAFAAAWITLSVHSDLAAVGLTAAVSTALAQAGIGCTWLRACTTTICSCPPQVRRRPWRCWRRCSTRPERCAGARRRGLRATRHPHCDRLACNASRATPCMSPEG